MPKEELDPVDDAFVEKRNRPNKNFNRDKLFISSDSCGRRLSATGNTHESCTTYLKFKLPDGVKSDWITEMKLHIYIPDFRFEGSTVEVHDIAFAMNATGIDWEENKITANSIPEDIATIPKYVEKTCEELGGLCGSRGRCQVGSSFNLGHVTIPLPVWRVVNGYVSFSVTGGDVNNCCYAYSKEANVEKNKKPRLEITYEHPKYKLSGMVYNAKTRNPIRNADVMLNGHKTKSGSEGRYELEALSGSYTLSVAKSGFRAYKESIELRKDTSKDIPLEAIVRKVEIIAEKTSGIRPISVSIDDEKETLKNVGDKTSFEFPPDVTLTVTAKPTLGILSYQVKAKPAKGEEISGGIFWAIKFYNLRKI